MPKNAKIYKEMPTNLTIFIYFFLYLPKSFGGALIVIKTKPPIPFDISFSSTYYIQTIFLHFHFEGIFGLFSLLSSLCVVVASNIYDFFLVLPSQETENTNRVSDQHLRRDTRKCSNISKEEKLRI